MSALEEARYFAQHYGGVRRQANVYSFRYPTMVADLGACLKGRGVPVKLRGEASTTGRVDVRLVEVAA